MDCGLATSLLGEAFGSRRRSFYVSVFRADPEQTSQSYEDAGKNAVNVFVHGFLRDRLGRPGFGRGAAATGRDAAYVRFVPALSPHVHLAGAGGQRFWQVNLTSFEEDADGDQLWSESDWPGDTLRVRFYPSDRRRASERLMPLVLGLVVTLATWAAGVGTSRWMRGKLLKVT